MSAENRLLRYARATLAGTLLTGAIELPFTGDYTNFQPQTASAHELDSPNFDISEVSPQLPQVVAALESKNIVAVLQRMSNSVVWGQYGEKLATIDRNNAVSKFTSSFKRNEGACIGYIMTGRNKNVPSLVMTGIGATQAASFGSLINVELVPVQGELIFRITTVQELTTAQLNSMRGDMKPCRGPVQVQNPRLGPQVEALPKPEVKPQVDTKVVIDSHGPESLDVNIKGNKIAYVSTEGNRSDIYIQNLDGSGQNKLTNDGRIKVDLRAISPGNIVYSDMGQRSESSTKSRVVSLDITAKKENVVWTGASSEGIPSCPSGNEKTIYWSSRETTQKVGENIYQASGLRESVRRVTVDDTGNSEHCAIVAQDGKVATYIYTDGNPGRPQGLAIYPSIDALSNFDPANLPKLIRGNMPVGWTPDSKWLLFTRLENETSNLYKIQSDGSSETKIMDGVWQASLSPDGTNLAVYASDTDSAHGNLYVVSVNGGKATRLPETFNGAVFPTWVIDKPSITRNIVLVQPGMDSIVIAGRDTTGLTDELFGRLTSYGYSPADFGMLSVRGGKMVDGRWIANDQKCSDTYRDPEFLGLSVAHDFKTILDSDPTLRVTGVGHSYGGLIIAKAMSAIAQGHVKLDQSRLHLMMVDAPLKGVRKPFFDYLGALFYGHSNANCLLFGDIPNPDYIIQPSGQYMLNMYQNQEVVDREWREVAETFISQKGQVETLGNIQDCVMAVEVCVGDLELETRLLLNLFWRKTPVITQEMPGATNIWRALGIEGYGHDRYFRDDQGLKVTLSVIGDQMSKQAGVEAVNTALQFTQSNGINLRDISFPKLSAI
jgi:hypothetical protein